MVVDLLAESFPNLLDVGFTAAMELQLDKIEEGELSWQSVIREFYGPFAQDLEKAHAELERITLQDEVSDEICDKCGRNMVLSLIHI